jgi:hypothetical protein
MKILRIQWEVISLVEKWRHWMHLDSRMSTAGIGCYCGINSLFHQGNWRQDFVSVKTSDPSGVKMSCVGSHDLWQENMERTLCMWLEEETQKWLSLCDAVVREKTVQLRVCLKTIWSPRIGHWMSNLPMIMFQGICWIFILPIHISKLSVQQCHLTDTAKD